jgi:N-acetylglutamate synthase-like GNAT family acetyltransferase
VVGAGTRYVLDSFRCGSSAYLVGKNGHIASQSGVSFCEILIIMIKIRKASEQDIPRIVELYEELTEEKIIVSPESLKHVFMQIESMPGHWLLVADEDGLVIGTVLLQIVPHLSHNAHPWGIVENMVVDSRYRRRGIGWILIDRIKEICREAGCYKIQLLSHKKRLEAHRFYHSLGFEDSALGFRLYI